MYVLQGQMSISGVLCTHSQLFQSLAWDFRKAKSTCRKKVSNDQVLSIFE